MSVERTVRRSAELRSGASLPTGRAHLRSRMPPRPSLRRSRRGSRTTDTHQGRNAESHISLKALWLAVAQAQLLTRPRSLGRRRRAPDQTIRTIALEAQHLGSTSIKQRTEHAPSRTKRRLPKLEARSIADTHPGLRQLRLFTTLARASPRCLDHLAGQSSRTRPTS